MLGLGDIAVPGLFIAFLAKFDAHLIGKKAFHKTLAARGTYFLPFIQYWVHTKL